MSREDAKQGSDFHKKDEKKKAFGASLRAEFERVGLGFDPNPITPFNTADFRLLHGLEVYPKGGDQIL